MLTGDVKPDLVVVVIHRREQANQLADSVILLQRNFRAFVDERRSTQRRRRNILDG